MTRIALVPCSSCGRHVRSSDSACPFCGTALTHVTPVSATTPGARLGRNATFVFATTLALAACSPGTPGTDGGSDAQTADTSTPPDDGGAMALYGAPVPVDAGADSAPGPDDGGSMALYGAPAPVDAGRDSAQADTGPGPDDGGNAALYGSPAPIDAGDADGAPGTRYGAPPPQVA
ncbi:MAG: zinc ribbon domain-containing protein [Deltaproteobacteria bacterium]|nr:zinc ribbon domain-containing protein [Deltaproteobacteria bacterium]